MSRGIRTNAHPLVAVLAWMVGLAVVLPVLWLVVAALKPADETFSRGLPFPPTFDNLHYVLTTLPLPRMLLNSAVVATVATALSLWFHSMAGYALARLRFPGRGIVFSLMIATLMVSLPVVLVPLFLIVRDLGLLNSYAGLILPGVFHAFGVFLLRQYYLSMPRELEDAAAIDGCGYWRLYWHVVLPLSKPMLAALGVLIFLANWNAFLWPLTITEDPDLRVVQVGIAGLQGEYSAAWNYLLAASLVAVIPTLVVFAAGQRWLVNALKTSGIR